MTDYKNMQVYHVGDSEKRPWGEYVTTAVGVNNGEEYCEKDITVLPNQILSLQSHNLRREHWTVTQGRLTVILDDQRLELDVGESVDIPLGGIHCMANLGDTPCVVHEKQEGVCREADIIRYLDAYGRADENIKTNEKVERSTALYRGIWADIESKKTLGNASSILKNTCC